MLDYRDRSDRPSLLQVLHDQLDEKIHAVIDDKKKQSDPRHKVYVVYIDGDGEMQRRVIRNVNRTELNERIDACGLTDGQFGIAVEDHYTYSIRGNCRELMDKVRTESGNHNARKRYVTELEVPPEPTS